MRIAGVLILGILCAGATFAQVTAGPAVNIAGGGSQALIDFRNTLTASQWIAVHNLGNANQIQNKVCPNCTAVDDAQVVAHGIVNPEPASGSGPLHILMPIGEKARLETINATLLSTLSALKGADKDYMDRYQAEERAKATTILEQIALRSEYIHDLVSRMGEQNRK